MAAVGVGAVFGMMAISDHNSADCNANNVCLTGPLNSARSAATVANVGFIAGGVLLATGLGLVLFAPGGGHGGHAAGVAVAPFVERGGGGIAVGGRL